MKTKSNFMFVVLFLSLIIEALFILAKPVEVKAETRTMKATAYCGCMKCNGKWTGQPTASGTKPKAGRTIAVDRHQIPLGTHVYVNGKEYIAEDTGSGIGYDCIDIYMDDHAACNEWGIKYVKVSW